VFEADALDLTPLVSFMQSRLVMGQRRLHEELQERWRECAVAITSENLRRIAECLEQRLATLTIDPGSHRFNLKHDAGGLLEHTLANFLMQLLKRRGCDPEPAPSAFDAAYTFLLRLREAIYGINQSHLMTHGIAAQVAHSQADSLTQFLDELTRRRRQVRATLQSLVGCLRESQL
jgi:hypothetical protein